MPPRLKYGLHIVECAAHATLGIYVIGAGKSLINQLKEPSVK